MKEYVRICPSCGNEISHTSKYNRNAHEKKKTPCRTCSCKLRYEKYGSHIDVINKEVKLGKRKNGFQDKKHTVESKEIMSQSHLNNVEPYQTQEFRNKMSIISSGENNPMYDRKIYDIWVEKYGIEEANKREIIRREKLSIRFSGINNPMYGKESPKKSGNGVSGWYKEFYFRSLHELQFILICERFRLTIKSVEKIRIKYISYTGNERTYSPDYIVCDKYLVEVKPLRLHNTPLNKLKFAAGRKYSNENNLKFKVLDFGIPTQQILNDLLKNNLIKLN